MYARELCVNLRRSAADLHMTQSPAAETTAGVRYSRRGIQKLYS